MITGSALPLSVAALDPAIEEALRMAADRHGTPCYVYLLDQIVERASHIYQIFGNRFEISYAMKANPNPELLKAIEQHIAGIDVSSGGELKLALAAGYLPKRVSFTGPGKSLQELSDAIDSGCGEIVAESMAEVSDIDRLSLNRGVVTRILLRVSPQSVPKGFGVNMAGRPSQFGIDEENLDPALAQLQEYKGIHFSGFHIYAGAQCLNSDSIIENFLNYIRIFTVHAERHALAPEVLVFGGGIGIPYHSGDEPVDLAKIAAQLNPALDALRARSGFTKARFMLEIGRLLVGEAGFFLTTVRRAKHSRGKAIRICDGGLNNHLAACGHFGTIIHRNYLITRLSDPNRSSESATAEAFDVFGPLCTTIDQLARQLQLPALDCGDILAFHSSGAYGFSASPMKFISHPCAKEIIITGKSSVNQL